jgi:L-amino acid N-acyltransferase YncA
MDLKIENMREEDWEQVRSIYLEGIASGHATFETEAPSWEGWSAGHIQACNIVARVEDKILGWAALSSVSGRCVYAGVAEVSVYVGQKYRGKKIGQTLLSILVERSEEEGIWTLQAGIFPENTSSIFLHKKCGFREVGRRDRIGKMKGIWRDVVLLERRSNTVGID